MGNWQAAEKRTFYFYYFYVFSFQFRSALFQRPARVRSAGTPAANVCSRCAISGCAAHKKSVPRSAARRAKAANARRTDQVTHQLFRLELTRPLSQWTTSRAAAWRAVRRTRPFRTRPLTDTCAVGKAHAMQPSGAGLQPATIQWRFQADCSCGKRQALKGSFRRNGQKVRQRRCPEMRGMSNGETADSRKRQTFVGMSH
jgi:hypothetical protein